MPRPRQRLPRLKLLLASAGKQKERAPKPNNSRQGTKHVCRARQTQRSPRPTGRVPMHKQRARRPNKRWPSKKLAEPTTREAEQSVGQCRTKVRQGWTTNKVAEATRTRAKAKQANGCHGPTTRSPRPNKRAPMPKT
eukprot:15481469-Alexandrium_andersonii.AAC.1